MSATGDAVTAGAGIPGQEAEDDAGTAGSLLLARLRRQKSTLFWAALVVLIVASAVLAPLLAPYDPQADDLLAGNQGPTSAHLLGTDRLGRDTLSRVLYGGQVALLAAALAVMIAVLIGVPLGLYSGWRGGWVDRVVQRFVEGVVSLPFLVLAIALVSVFGPGLYKSMVVVGVVYAMTMLRLTRAETVAAREEVYVKGLTVTGASTFRTLFAHILPNVAPALIVQTTFMISTAIIAEATLSFLGLGAQPPQASWGSMLTDAQSSLRDNFFLAVPPGVAILVTVLAFNQLGDGVRDLFAREAKGGSLGVNPTRPLDETTDVETGTGSVEDPVLAVRDLSVSFPGPDGTPVDVVQQVSFDLGRGEILGLVGESGSGKSVTAMSVLGLVPDPGRVRAASIRLEELELGGRSFDDLRSVRGARIGVVFQDPLGSLNPAYTVGDQVGEALRLHRPGMTRAQARARALELFEKVHIPRAENRLDDYPHQFSGGMAQRVMIAMALACEPQVLVADEPTTALDVTVQGQVLDLLLELRDSVGMAILIITHDLGVVASVADRVAVMYAGQIVEAGETHAVFHHPQHPYTEGLLTSLPRNVRRAGSLPFIAGSVPPPHRWRPSCHFADRCGHATAACTEGPISLEPVADASDRVVRCIRHNELGLTGLRSPEQSEPELVSSDRRTPVSASVDRGRLPLVSVRNLSVTFPGRRRGILRRAEPVRAVREVDLEIRAGETLGLVGESGSGKTTTAAAILRLVEPDDGTIEVDGFAEADLRPRVPLGFRRAVQAVFQDPNASLDPTKSIGQTLEEPLTIHFDLSKAQRRARVRELIEQVGLSTIHLSRYPYQLSGGQRQRIAIAKALAVDPKVIILDEPVSALDVSVQSQIINLLEELQRNTGVAYLLVAHDLAVVRHASDRIAVMYRSRIVEEGPADRICDEPAHPYTKALIEGIPDPGSPNVNRRDRIAAGRPGPDPGPGGCPFVGRCSQALSGCRETFPRGFAIERGGSVWCHLYEPVPAHAKEEKV
jgi:oligopeptide/dipeptide ABC transporter ATP-binding protein